jgi:hypothetical protein
MICAEQELQRGRLLSVFSGSRPATPASPLPMSTAAALAARARVSSPLTPAVAVAAVIKPEVAASSSLPPPFAAPAPVETLVAPADPLPQ